METEDQGGGSTESRGDRMARGPERDHGVGTSGQVEDVF